MTESGSFELVRALFEQASQLPVEQRQAWLAGQCVGDAALLNEVTSLLERAESPSLVRTGGGVAAAAGALAERMRLAAATPPPRRIGQYEILRELGRGGMGVVYEAMQSRPARKVAIKLLDRDVSSERARARLEREGEFLARLAHPCIARVYETGFVDGETRLQPYIAMELVVGSSLRDWVQSTRPDLARKLRLFVELCGAVHHAHQRGVLHRDLKPENVLVDEAGLPKVLDFGIARAFGADARAMASLTDAGAIVGTLPYMSPEQLAEDAAEVDTRSDVYSLGVLLYELVSGSLPHPVAHLPLARAIETIRTCEPAPLRHGHERFSADLALIAAKAIEKDPERRYASAAALADDVEHHLRDEPIAARPPSTWYQLGKLARRNRAAVAGVVSVVVVLVLGLAGTYSQAVRAGREAESAKEINNLYRALFTSVDPEEGGRDVRLIDVIDQCVEYARTQFGGRPDVQAAVFDTFAISVLSLGDIERAAALAESALATRIEKTGASSADTAESRHTLAQIRHSQSRLDEAEPLYRRAFEDLRRARGAGHRDVLIYAHDLANAWIERGRSEEGERLLRDTLRRQREQFGPQDDDVLTSLNALSNLMVATGRVAEGLAIQEELFDLRKQSLGDDNAIVLNAQNNLAAAYYGAGKLERAEELWRDCLSRRERVLGADHQNTLNVLNSIVAVTLQRGRLEEAEPLARSCAERMEAKLGHDHEDVLNARNMLAQVLVSRKQYEEARAILDDVLELGEHSLGSSNPEVAVWRLTSAECNYFLGRWNATLEDLRASAAVLRPDDPRLMRVRKKLTDDLDAKHETLRAAELRAIFE